MDPITTPAPTTSVDGFHDDAPAYFGSTQEADPSQETLTTAPGTNYFDNLHREWKKPCWREKNLVIYIVLMFPLLMAYPGYRFVSYLMDYYEKCLEDGYGKCDFCIERPPNDHDFSYHTKFGDAADVDGDGLKDFVMLVNSFGKYYIEVLIQDENGAFQVDRAKIVEVPSPWTDSPTLDIIDINGDTFPDIIYLSRDRGDDNNIILLMNDGTGGYREPALYRAKVAQRPIFFDAIDINGDTFPDIIYVSGDSLRGYNFTMLMNDGTGINQEPGLNLTLPQEPESVHLLDMDGDGFPDILLAKKIWRIAEKDKLFVNNGDGTFRSPIDLPSIPNIVADFNGDGALDMLTDVYEDDDNSFKFNVWISNGDLTFQAPIVVNIPDLGNVIRLEAWNFEVGDIDGNGFLDVILFAAFERDDSSVKGTMVGLVYLNMQGDGNLEDAVKILVDVNRDYHFSADYLLLLSDMNGDGALDIVTHFYSEIGVLVLLGNGNGTFQDYEHVPCTSFRNSWDTKWSYNRMTIASLTVADMNNDGKPDVLLRSAILDNRVLTNLGDGVSFAGDADASPWLSAAAPL